MTQHGDWGVKRTQDLAGWLSGPLDSQGLQAARTVWSQPEAFRRSALYIYINQMAIPKIMSIERTNSSRFDSMDTFLPSLKVTVHFLRMVVGLTSHPDLQGGVQNPKIIEKLRRVHLLHANLPTIRGWMMNYIGSVIAVAPLRVMDALPDDKLTKSYWEYMRHAWSFMGAEIGTSITPVRTDEGVAVEELAEATPDLARDLMMLQVAYTTRYGPDQAKLLWDRVLNSLYPTIRTVVDHALVLERPG